MQRLTSEIDNVGTTLAWVADDVPIGLVAFCRLQRDQAGTSSKKSALDGRKPKRRARQVAKGRKEGSAKTLILCESLRFLRTLCSAFNRIMAPSRRMPQWLGWVFRLIPPRPGYPSKRVPTCSAQQRRPQLQQAPASQPATSWWDRVPEYSRLAASTG